MANNYGVDEAGPWAMCGVAMDEAGLWNLGKRPFQDLYQRLEKNDTDCKNETGGDNCETIMEDEVQIVEVTRSDPEDVLEVDDSDSHDDIQIVDAMFGQLVTDDDVQVIKS